MRHWSEEYIGCGQFDCADFIQKVLKEQRGLDITLPGNRAWRGREPKDLADFGAAYADPVTEPKDFDIVLMHIFGRKHDLGAHVGVSALLCGSLWILHAVKNLGVIFSPKHSLQLAGFKIEGYYRCRT